MCVCVYIYITVCAGECIKHKTINKYSLVSCFVTCLVSYRKRLRESIHLFAYCNPDAVRARNT